MKVLIAIAAAGAAATVALAPTTSQARSLHEQHGASRVLSYASAAAVAIQPDGKIVAGGRRDGAGYTHDPAESSDFALARYKPNGRLDPSFGAGGRVLTDFSLSFDSLEAVVLQPDGKIVAGGYSSRPDGGSGFALARYESRGRLDPSFGRHGKVRIRFGPSGSAAYALALQPDGKIVAAGTNSGNEVTPQSWVVARFNPGGSLDRSFGNGGDVTTAFGLMSSAGAVTLEPNGKIVVLGSSCDHDYAACGLAVARYEADGSLDPGFGSGGKATTHFAGFDDIRGNGVAVQADGKIVAAGTAGNEDSGNYNFIVARYNGDGSLDADFGTGGTVMTDFEPGSDESLDFASALALEPDGAVVVAGTDSHEHFAVALYDAHGKLDPSFGGTGFVQTDLSGEDEARAVAIARDGKIVTAGLAHRSRFALVRYGRDGALDQKFGKAGSVFTAFGSPVTVVTSFSAADKDRGDLVQWRTAVEVNARGFNVYRERKGHQVRVNRTLLRSKGSSARGASYSFFDKAAPPHGQLRYWLQVVKQDGRRVWYGAVVPAR